MQLNQTRPYHTDTYLKTNTQTTKKNLSAVVKNWDECQTTISHLHKLVFANQWQNEGGGPSMMDQIIVALQYVGVFQSTTRVCSFASFFPPSPPPAILEEISWATSISLNPCRQVSLVIRQIFQQQFQSIINTSKRQFRPCSALTKIWMQLEVNRKMEGT